ncbi:hypothetical protein CDL12_15640 [Handroanthus impetiginosus]|uniref:Ty3-gypsy retrotransposon protein n=1 Tax=Handroanthus impetiginosus TaxID=429701 RepID=A0A2G9H2N6_9LAMI|nr:hypothetical protein CDL12_15640 [Handroanthus impetiginosus]
MPSGTISISHLFLSFKVSKYCMAAQEMAAFKIITAESFGIITKSMSKKLQSSSDMTPSFEAIEKSLPYFTSENNSGWGSKNVLASSTPHSTSSSSFTLHIAPIMVINGTTLEEQIANLTRAIERLAKHIQEQDFQISKLMNEVDDSDTSRIMEKQLEAHDDVETSMRPQSNEKEKSSVKELQISSNGLIPVDQLKEFIMGTIKNKLDGRSKSSLSYIKPYTL